VKRINDIGGFVMEENNTKDDTGLKDDFEDFTKTEKYKAFREKAIKLLPDNVWKDEGKRFMEFIRQLAKLPAEELEELLEEADIIGKEGILYRLKRANII